MSRGGGGCNLSTEFVGVIVEVDALAVAGRVLLRQSGTDGAEGGSIGLLVLPALFHQLVAPAHRTLQHTACASNTRSTCIACANVPLRSGNHRARTQYITVH